MMKIQLGNRAFALGLVVAVGACGDSGGSTASATDSSSGSTTGTTTETTGTSETPTSSSASTTTSGASNSGTDSTSTTAPDPTTGTGTSTTDTSTTTGVVPETTTGTTDDSTGTTTDSTTTDTTDSTTTGDTTTGTTDDTSTGTTGEPIDCGNLPVTYRDFQPLHVDFGCHMSGNFGRPGLVMSDLGADLKPVYNPNPPPPPPGWAGTNPQITSQSSFNEWYNAVNGVNQEIAGELELMEIQPGLWSFASASFYPLTGMGWGNNVAPNWAGQTFPDRNGSFTTEIHTSFIYQVGQQFTFIGDDDVWVYIDGKLALDLGGLHPPDMDTIDLDTLGLVPGLMYTLDVFHAERCESGSNFRIDTSISCFVPQ